MRVQRNSLATKDWLDWQHVMSTGEHEGIPLWDRV